MTREPVPLWSGDPPGWDPAIDQPRPVLTPYIVDSEEPLAAVLVLPGGAYQVRAEHEKRPIAEWVNSIGLTAFVLDYRVKPYHHKCIREDAKRAVRLIRHRAVEWNVRPDRIAALGFSAGGHLTASLGTRSGEKSGFESDEIDALSARPDAMVLCYPFISFELVEPAEIPLCGPDASEAEKRAMSVNNVVDESTPPAFIWHTFNDAAVSVRHSLLFADALCAHGVSCEMHIFREGDHGLGLARDVPDKPGKPDVAVWTGLCETWLRGMGFLA